MKKITAKRRPRKCKQCGSTKIADIIYGLVRLSPEGEREVQEGRIVLGGCEITECDPNWQCVDCGLQIYKNKKCQCRKCGKVYYSSITPLGSYTLCPDCEKLINA